MHFSPKFFGTKNSFLKKPPLLGGGNFLDDTGNGFEGDQSNVMRVGKTKFFVLLVVNLPSEDLC